MVRGHDAGGSHPKLLGGERVEGDHACGGIYGVMSGWEEREERGTMHVKREKKRGGPHDGCLVRQSPPTFVSRNGICTPELLNGHIQVPLDGKSGPDTVVRTYSGGLGVRFGDALRSSYLLKYCCLLAPDFCS